MRNVIRSMIVVGVGFVTAVIQTSAQADTIRVGVVSDGQSEWSDRIVAELRTELANLEDSQTRFELVPDNVTNGQWQREIIDAGLRSQLYTTQIDIVVAIGLLASDTVPRTSLNKPIIAANVVSPPLQAFPLTQAGTSGEANLHYLATNVDLVSALTRFQQATDAGTIGIVADRASFDAMPFLREAFEGMAKEVEAELQPILIQPDDISSVIGQLPERIDAVFILPQLRLSEAQQQVLITGVNQRRLPSYSMLGRTDVEAGYLMGTALVPNAQQLSRRLAIDIRDIALGRSAAGLPVAFDVKDRLSINMSTARDIGFSPPFTLLLEADQLNVLAERGRALSLYLAVDESIKRNLALAIADADFQLAVQDTRVARSSLLPQLSGTADWEALDADNAITRQTRTSTVGLSVTQTIYSESQVSNFTSNRFLQLAEQADFSATRLDVIESTATAYLNVLIAKTQLTIQQDNLRLTLANLDRAEFRYKVGSADRSEFLRFQTELGEDRQSVTTAQSNFQQEVNELNRILHRPINEAFSTREPGLTDPKIFGDSRLEAFLKSPKQVALFSDFLTQQTIKNAPELVSLKNQIRSQERLLLAAKRKRYVPDVTLAADVSRVVDDNATPFATDYDNDWSLGVQFSWTLYQGSRINAERSQASIALQQLKYRQAQLLDSLETDTRNAVVQAGASRINIQFAQDSALAAEQTLDLVTDAYVRGAASYIDLIDAQSSYLSARLTSANAIYTHLQDLMAVQRAIGFFDFYVAPEQAQQWFNQLYQFAQQQRVSP